MPRQKPRALRSTPSSTIPPVGSRTGDFDYDFPTELVAQRPLDDRAASRLLVLERSTGLVGHKRFRDLPSMLHPGDVLVRNVSRVIPARLRGQRENGRDAEVLLVHADSDGSWLAMVHPGGKLKTGRRVRFGYDAEAEVVDVVGGGLRRLRWSGRLTPREVMLKYGTIPLPPYIRRPPEPEDWMRYQTVFANQEGSIAAPTAGLHFTEELLHEIERRHVRVVDVVLHVGPGTFKPVAADAPADHTMHAEWYTVPLETADVVNAARAAEGRIWAVGTTAVRTLETAGVSGQLQPSSGWTNLFIYPPYEFRQVDALVTNFHRPRSTLLMLVAAFAGLDATMAAYREAIQRRYRLFSYGDAMVIV